MEDNNIPVDQKVEATAGCPAPDTKRRKRKRSQDKWKGSKKRKQNKPKFWIEDCCDTIMTTDINSGVPCLELLITRSTLTDDYLQAPLPCLKTTSSTKIENKTPHENDDGEFRKAESIGPSKADFHVPSDELSTSDDVRTDVQVKEMLPTKSATNNIDQDTAENNDLSPMGDGSSQQKGLGAFESSVVFIKRSNSAKKPMKSGTPSVEHFMPLPNGDCGDGIVNPFPKDEVGDKYWSQRRRLFTRFDKGIQLDKESWFSVTPEAIANHIAAHLVGSRKNVIVLDPFCGCGGNTIAFARRTEVDLVVGVDIDLSKLKKAASNAAIYEVPPEKIVLVNANGSKIMSCYKNKILTINNQDNVNKNGTSMQVAGFRIGGMDLLPKNVHCIFLSPPWGGVGYGEMGKRNYTLRCIKVQSANDEKEYDNGEEILQYAADCLGRNGPIAYFLPKNTNGTFLGKSVLKVGYGGPVVMEQNVLNGKLKTITAYIGL
jgi:trimethylguanosine synthase